MLPQPFLSPRSGARPRAPRRGGRLQGSAVHPRRQAGDCATRPRGVRSRRWDSPPRSSTSSTPRADGIRRVPVFCRTSIPACMTADGPAASAAGVRVDGADARDGQPRGSSRARRTAFRLPGQEPGGAARHLDVPPASSAIPMTTGLLIGIGETRRERLQALLALRELQAALRTSAGDHHPELSRQARHPHGARIRAAARRTPVDDRRGAAGVRCAACRCRHRRICSRGSSPRWCVQASTTGVASRR